MNQSKKQRKYKKQAFRMTKKWRGGQTQNEEKPLLNKSVENAAENPEDLNKIKEEVESEKTLHIPTLNLGDSEILKTSGELAEGVAVNTLDSIGEIAGVDLSDPKLVEENKEKIVQMSKNAAEVGMIALEAAEPFAKPLMAKTIETGGEILTNVGKAGVKVLLNTAEEIPGVGIIFGSIRSISNIAEAAISSINAGTEVVTSTADAVNATTKNFERLVKEREDITNRTSESIQKFTGGSRKYRSPLVHLHKKSRKYKKKYYKSRR